MNGEFEQILQTFIQEAKELLQNMEESLLRLESEPDNPGAIGAVFRAAHTIKGSAGLFGFDQMVGFTHILEDVLDRVRNGDVAIDKTLIALLLECSDHIYELLKVTVIDEGILSEHAQARERQLRKRLRTYQPTITAPVAVEQVESVVREDGAVASDLWHISLRLSSDVLRHGMDPLTLLRYLGNLGRVASITTIADRLPELGEMDPETFYLGFEIDFASDVDKAAIADVFEFVRDDSVVHILPPHSKIAEYLHLIRSLPEADSRLGEILVQSGALTSQELAAGLEQQQIPRVEGDAELLGEILVEQGAVEPVVLQAALDKQSSAKEQKRRESHYIRVQADKLDRLINLVGELVIASAGTRLIAQNSQNAAFYESALGVTDLVEEIRDGALRMRMVPIGDTFNRFQRVVRDISHELGKEIELQISGADTEVDKTVVEKISDPLMHLLRNSMDHGIESPERRIALGKSPRGKLSLNAYHDSGSIAIEIADDGAGLNRQRIRDKAVERELISADAVLSDEEIDNLIFEAGFSTAEQVTSLSGRGVGMDVVKRNIMSLRGSIQLNSDPGRGTLVRIRLPLTLAIIDGFLVGVGHSSYVVPLDLVQECVELAEPERTVARQHQILNLRGEVLPLIFLRSHFGLDAGQNRRENVVVVRCAGCKAGLVVDELQGEFQTVIKPLGKLFSGLRGVSGSTILGDGSVALILDVPSLIQLIMQKESRNPDWYGGEAGVARIQQDYRGTLQ
jgi:two-component system chemotaxis sensor kinase CheA